MSPNKFRTMNPNWQNTRAMYERVITSSSIMKQRRDCDLVACRPTSGNGYCYTMVTSSNGHVFRVTGPLCGNSPVTGEFPSQRPVTQSFAVFFHLCPNKHLSKQSWGWWFETPSRSLLRHCNARNANLRTLTKTYRYPIIYRNTCFAITCHYCTHP